MDLIKNVKKSFELKTSKLIDEILKIEGMSSSNIRHFLNNLCSFPEVNYLEIGTWKGSTILSASYMNDGTFTAIDNFSQRFLKCHAKQDLIKNLKKFEKQCNVKFFEENSWNFDLSYFKNKINVYFYDGNHSYEDTRMAYTYYNTILDNIFITIIDDWNLEHVRKATNSIFKELNYKISYEKEIFTPNNGHSSWWNGFYVAVVKK